jgi:hypothetical protein
MFSVISTWSFPILRRIARKEFLAPSYVVERTGAVHPKTRAGDTSNFGVSSPG